MTANEKQMAQLPFLFTPEGFLVDPSVQDLRPEHQKFLLVADTFFRVLTSLPELEVAREDVKTEPSEEICRQLLDAVPFVIGSEHLTKKMDWADVRKACGYLPGGDPVI